MIWLESIPRLWLQMPPMIKDKTKRYAIKKKDKKTKDKVNWMKLSVWEVSPTFGYRCHQIEKKKIIDNRKKMAQKIKQDKI